MMLLRNKKYNIVVLSHKSSEKDILKKNLSEPYLNILFFENLGDFISFSLKGKPADMIMLSKSLSDISARDMVLILRRNKKNAKSLIVFFSDEFSPQAEDFNCGIDEFFDLRRGDFSFIKVRIFNLLVRKDLSQEEERVLKFKELSVFMDSHLAKLGEKEIELTDLEFKILVYFLENKGRIITRNNLIEAVWKNPLQASLRSVDKRIEILRKRLGKIGKHIKTVFSVGYIWQ